MGHRPHLDTCRVAPRHCKKPLQLIISSSRRKEYEPAKEERLRCRARGGTHDSFGQRGLWPAPVARRAPRQPHGRAHGLDRRPGDPRRAAPAPRERRRLDREGAGSALIRRPPSAGKWISGERRLPVRGSLVVRCTSRPDPGAVRPRDSSAPASRADLRLAHLGRRRVAPVITRRGERRRPGGPRRPGDREDHRGHPVDKPPLFGGARRLGILLPRRRKVVASSRRRGRPDDRGRGRRRHRSDRGRTERRPLLHHGDANLPVGRRRRAAHADRGHGRRGVRGRRRPRDGRSDFRPSRAGRNLGRRPARVRHRKTGGSGGSTCGPG